MRRTREGMLKDIEQRTVVVEELRVLLLGAILRLVRRVQVRLSYRGGGFRAWGWALRAINLYWCSVSCFTWGGVLDSSDLLLSYSLMCNYHRP